MKSIDFYYDYGSPTAYLAWTRITNADIEKFEINYFPVLLGGIFKATNNRPPAEVPAKANWMFNDIKMYANKYKVDFNLNSAFPVNTLYLMRGAIFAMKNGMLEKYNNVIFKAMWVENKNLSEGKTIVEILEKNDFNSNDFLEAAENQDVKNELKDFTSKAIDLGIFGVPSFIVDGELFFGQDRMHWFLD